VNDGPLRWCHVHHVGTAEAACWIDGCDEQLRDDRPGAWTDSRPPPTTNLAATWPVLPPDDDWGYYLPPSAA
jgi:hypothetical protein